MFWLWFFLTNALWLAGSFMLWRIPRCRPHPPQAGYPATSVIIPARDEANALPTLLASLAGQDLPPDELLVVDDHSRDATVALAEAAGARVIAAADLPEGWLGKPWACQQGADQAKGEILIFLDADTRLEPGGFRALIDTFMKHPGALSVSPYHQVPTWPEQCSAFFNILQLAGMRAFTLLGSRLKPAGIFGPCLVISHADYRSSGGHAAVKNELLEHYALAARLTRLKIPLQLRGGRGVLHVRLYPGGWRALARGWSKSFARGAHQTPAGMMLVIIAWISGMITTTAFLVKSALSGIFPEAGLWSVAYVFYAGQVLWHLRRMGSFRWLTAILFPIPLAFFLAVFLWSTYLTVVRKEVAWKGRALRL